MFLTFRIRSLSLLNHFTRPKTPGTAPKLLRQHKPVPSKSSIHLHNSVLTHLGNFFAQLVITAVDHSSALVK